jgi:hypothetical protein
MPTLVECIEILASVAPSIAVLLLLKRGARTISGWFMQVLGSASLAIMSLGMLLTRLTATCSTTIKACADSTTQVLRTPGLFSHCSTCVTDSSATILISRLNQYALPIHAGAAALCVCASFVAIIRFVLWAKRTLRNSV